MVQGKISGGRVYSKARCIDYFDTYSPVIKITTIRALIALVVIYNLPIHQMDVKTVFLNGDLEEKIYMTKLEEFKFLSHCIQT